MLKVLSLLEPMKKYGSRDHIRCEGNDHLNIELQDQFGPWHHYKSKQEQADAYRITQRRAE